MIDMSRVDSIRKLRKEGETIAGIAQKTGVSEPTVRKYLSKDDFSPTIPKKKTTVSKLDPFKKYIDKWLDEDRSVWYKQHHTAKRIFERLQEEHGADVSYGTVQRYIKEQKEQMRADSTGQQYLDLIWLPGEMQVDFGQADFVELGIKKRLHHLVSVFPHSNTGQAQVFYGENGECVCEGLKAIFEYIGGVPVRIIFDNTTGVGRRIGDIIRLSETFKAFSVHYGFDYSFTSVNAGNEKGAVENKVGTIRRSLFVPVPRIENIMAYNKRLLDRCYQLSEKIHYRKGRLETELFKEDQKALYPL